MVFHNFQCIAIQMHLQFWLISFLPFQSTYGFRSCIMERVGYIVPRLFMGLIVQVICSYSTLPLYALVSQVGELIHPRFTLHELLND
ncbi:hypothetical protein DKX38_000551 [Salix brachista]|uniref:Uncharacterized protein n=1 Tax=Salix brachista TaxID=2182728 RepID=A0A5N5P2D2_9ROSI|nr:hypothetical protein DKX38_000551 [Salix brachista]